MNASWISKEKTGSNSKLTKVHSFVFQQEFYNSRVTIPPSYFVQKDPLSDLSIPLITKIRNNTRVLY